MKGTAHRTTPCWGMLLGAVLTVLTGACDTAAPPADEAEARRFVLWSVAPDWYPYLQVPDDWPALDALVSRDLPTVIAFRQHSLVPYAVMVLEEGTLVLEPDGRFSATYEVDWFRRAPRGVDRSTGTWTAMGDSLLLLQRGAQTLRAIPVGDTLHVGTWPVPVGVVGLDAAIYDPFQLRTLVFVRDGP